MREVSKSEKRSFWREENPDLYYLDNTDNPAIVGGRWQVLKPVASDLTS